MPIVNLGARWGNRYRTRRGAPTNIGDFGSPTASRPGLSVLLAPLYFPTFYPFVLPTWEGGTGEAAAQFTGGYDG
jgi:hypothetical protein